MNKEIIKAMNKKEKKTTWWKKNGYKVMRIILFPIWFGIIGKEKFDEWLNSHNTWNEERADEIFNYYIPRCAKWNAEDKHFYFFDNGYGWNMCFAKRYLKRKDRRFWKVNSGWAGGKMRQYLINKFELDGFTKEVGNCSEGWTEIIFTIKEGI